MKETNARVKVTLNSSLYAQLEKRAEQVGMSIASYLRMLAINDLRANEEERLGSTVLPATNSTQQSTPAIVNPPQVIVVNNDGDVRTPTRRAGTSDWRDRRRTTTIRATDRSEPKTVKLDDVLKLI